MIRAFSPGSVTLFFEIRDEHEDPLKKGSRGVGVCLSRGVITTLEEGDDLQIFINGKRREGTIQEDVAEFYGFKGTIRSEVQLPISQGFGMSGAAALSTSLALGNLFGYTYLKSLHIAHGIELERKSGLGDIASQYVGGFTLRIREGIQPYGIVDRLFVPKIPIILVILDEEVETKEILQDKEMRKKIKREGARAMDKFLASPTLENAIRIAREFSFKTSLMSEEARNFLEECENSVMAMIGNSAIVFGKCKNEILNDYKIIKVEIGDRAKILED